MKSRILCALLAVLLLTSMLPLAVSATDPDVTVKFINKDESTISMTITPGATKYVTTSAEGVMTEWTDAAAAPADNFIKLDYPADGAATLKVTLKNINADSESTKYHMPAIEFGEGNYAIAMELIGTNKIADGNSAGLKYSAANGMTITGAGSLAIKLTKSAAGALWANGGNLLIKNTTLDITVAQGNHSLHHAIFASKGSVSIEGSKITSTTDGGSCVYLGTTDEKAGGTGWGRYTLDDATDRYIKIKDSEVTVKINQNKNAFQSANPAVISNTTLKITLGASSGPLFTPVPTFEGEYTAIAGLAKNAEKLEKLKVFEPKKTGSYTYFYMVPGIVELLPTEPTTEPTEPSTPDTTTPDATTPDATTPDATTPDATTPDATTPDATIPDATTPDATTPNESKPAEDNKPGESKPAADTDVTAQDEEKGGNALKVVLIVVIVVLVAAGAAVGVLFYLKKKKA